jgi:hypothetical protein
MADVQVQSNGGRGGLTTAIVILVIVILALVAWIVFGGGLTTKKEVDINIDAPAVTNPSGGSNTGGSGQSQ